MQLQLNLTIKGATFVLKVESAIIVVMFRKILRVPTLASGDTISCLHQFNFCQVSREGSDMEYENHDCSDSGLLLVEFKMRTKSWELKRDGRFA